MTIVNNDRAVVFDHEAHFALWDWLVNNPGKDKDDWPGWKNYAEADIPRNHCFACGACKCVCKNCPMEWADESNCIDETSNNVFYLWHHEHEPGERVRLAKVIRDMPLRTGVVIK